VIKRAFYFGCYRSNGPKGHYLRGAFGEVQLEKIPGFPWTIGNLDTGLLDNGKHPDVINGNVYWTVGKNLVDGGYWYAFFWWDRTGDSRPNSNSGFYVSGFGWPEKEAAFAYACEVFPEIVTRQPFPLKLIDKDSG
jgi:hypothetical protein